MPIYLSTYPYNYHTFFLQAINTTQMTISPTNIYLYSNYISLSPDNFTNISHKFSHHSIPSLVLVATPVREVCNRHDFVLYAHLVGDFLGQVGAVPLVTIVSGQRRFSFDVLSYHEVRRRL